MQCNKIIKALEVLPLQNQWLYEIYGRVLWGINEYLRSLKLSRLVLYVIGSIAKGEPSCTKVCNDLGRCFLMISDLDLLAFANISTYLKCILLHCDHYVKRLERLFLKKNIDFHISLSLAPPLVYRLGLSKLNTIDYYELAAVVCFENKRICELYRKDRFPYIDRRDILDLAISSFVDVLSVILKPRNKSNDKDTYILSKRILTLLYCIELYLGLKPRSFSETPLIATMNFEKLESFIDKNDLELLNTLSSIKSLNSCRETSSIPQSDKDKLIHLYKKLLKGFLIRLSNDLGVTNTVELLTRTKEGRLISRRKLLPLLLLYVALYTIAKLLHRDVDKIRGELVTMLRYRMRLVDFLRLLALKYLILLVTSDLRMTKYTALINAGLKLVDAWYRYMVL